MLLRVEVLIGMAPIYVFKCLATGSGTIRKCVLVGRCVALWGWALRSHMLKLRSVWTVSFFLPVDPDV